MKKFSTIICISLFNTLIFSLSYATKPSLLSLNMDMKLEFSGPVEIDKEVIVTLSFTPLQKVVRHSTLDDRAEIHFDSNMISLIRGNPKWMGKLQKDKTEKITIVVKPVKFNKAGYICFWGYIKSSRTDPSKLSAERKDQLPLEGSFLFHNTVYEEFKVGEPVVDSLQEIWVIDAQTGKATRQRVKIPLIPMGKVDSVKVQKNPKR